MEKTFTVVSSTPTQNGAFCNKIANKSEVTVQTAFGTMRQNRQETYYLFTESQNSVGSTGRLDPDNFRIVEKSYTIPDDDGSAKEITLKYLYPSR